MPSIPRYYSDNVTQRSTFNMSSIFQYYSTFSFVHSFSIASKMETFTGIVLNIYFFWHGYTCLHSATFSLMEIFKSFWSVFKWFSYFSIWFLSSLQISAPWIDFILFHFVGSGISFKYCYIFFCLLLFHWDGQFHPSNFSRTVELHFSSVLWPMENKWLKFSSKCQLRTIDKMKQYKSTKKINKFDYCWR